MPPRSPPSPRPRVTVVVGRQLLALMEAFPNTPSSGASGEEDPGTVAPYPLSRHSVPQETEGETPDAWVSSIVAGGDGGNAGTQDTEALSGSERALCLLGDRTEPRYRALRRGHVRPNAEAG